MYIYIYMYICIYVHIHIHYIYVCIHTYIHIYNMLDPVASEVEFVGISVEGFRLLTGFASNFI